MPSHIEPSPHTRPQSYPMAGAITYGGAVDGWIVPGTSHEASYAEYVELDTAEIGTFDASVNGLTVTIEGGEAYVGGKYLAIDETTDVTLPADDTVTVSLGYPANSADAVQIQLDSDFPGYSSHIPIWEFDTDSDSVQTSADLRPVGPDTASGVTVYGRDEADAEFLTPDEGDDAYLSLSGGTVTGGVTVEGGVTAEAGVEIVRESAQTFVTATDEEHGTTMSWRNTGDGDFELVPDHGDGNGYVWDNSLRYDFDGTWSVRGDQVTLGAPTSVSGNLTVGGDLIEMDATGQVGLSMPGGVFYSSHENRSTIYNDSSDQGAGWALRDPEGVGNALTVESDGEGALAGPLELGGGPDDASFNLEADNVAMRRTDVQDEFVGSEQTREIVVSDSEPSTYSYQDGDLWVDLSGDN